MSTRIYKKLEWIPFDGLVRNDENLGHWRLSTLFAVAIVEVQLRCG